MYVSLLKRDPYCTLLCELGNFVPSRLMSDTRIVLIHQHFSAIPDVLHFIRDL